MSYYNSSTSSSSSSHYIGPSSYSSSSSYYNDMYRSYSNLRSLAPSYSQPFYLSTIPTSSSFHKRISPPSSPSILKSTATSSKSPSSLLARSATCRLQPPSSHSTTTTEKFTKTTISEIYSKADDDGDLNSMRVPISIVEPNTRKRENSYESVYTSSSRSSTPASNLANNASDSTHDLANQQQQQQPSQQTQPQPQPTQQSNSNSNESNNDVNATAISSIRLNCTDDLTTQVDYYLNEVDNRMICRGKTIELESFELSGKTGLISKCLYLNDLLADANLSELNLESDPVFGAGDQGKCTLLFLSVKDSEAFANRHSDKFTVVFTNDVEKTRVNAAQALQSSSKKNVSFNENEENDSDNSNNTNTNSSNKKSILKSSSNQLSQSKSCDSISSKATIGLGNNLRGSNENLADPANVLVSAKQKNKAEGYEILTIRAKLKQRVGQNRTKPVELQDIDSIMRNVVTIIQDEFMKRFPSGPSPNAATTSASNSAIKQN